MGGVQPLLRHCVGVPLCERQQVRGRLRHAADHQLGLPGAALGRWRSLHCRQLPAPADQPAGAPCPPAVSGQPACWLSGQVTAACGPPAEPGCLLSRLGPWQDTGAQEGVSQHEICTLCHLQRSWRAVCWSSLHTALQVSQSWPQNGRNLILRLPAGGTHRGWEQQHCCGQKRLL